jgi:hypothetical protein
MTIKEALYREIDTLPDSRKGEVLSFVRFLKIGLADVDQLDRNFEAALDSAEKTARERKITEKDVQNEVDAVRRAR